jgi:glycosyltransferase involved in cell wall biosynthesis
VTGPVDPPLRIAILTTSWPSDESDPSGHFVRAHARDLERAGHTVTVLAPAPGGAFGWPGAAARIRERPLRALSAARWVIATRARARKLDVDRIVAHWAVPCAWPIAAACAAPLHVVSHGGDVRLLGRLPRPVRAAIVRSLIARAREWQFVSTSLLDELLESLDPETQKELERIARVEAAALEMPDVASAVLELRRELGAHRVAVSVGRLVASKRVDKVIDYVSRTATVERLVVVGDGPERSRLEGLASRLGVEVEFLGMVSRSRALAWIGAADVLVHASEAEGSSTVVREAEALGTRVEWI